MLLRPPLHTWDLDPAAARRLQLVLADRADTRTPLDDRWRTVAAADVTYNRSGEWLQAAVVVVDRHTGAVRDRAAVSRRARFPYIPGLLSFRELPPVLEAFALLAVLPDLVLCDGQGLAHPRRLGLACHLGLWLDRPTIGCAKTRLCGVHAPPGPRRGQRSPLLLGDQIVGAVLRTRDGVAPLYVSPGHRCDLESAVQVVIELGGRYRLPEPARLAHATVNAVRTALSSPDVATG